jgi:regulator of protease activity HflC (stomatin/prohibitin superfamily)
VEHVFGWIGQIFQTLLRIFPWLVIVPATQAGVAFVHGRRIKEWQPGLHWYWPLVTTYKLMTTVRQTQRIQSKVIMTKDLKTVTAGALVTYVVDDVVAAVAKVADLPSDIMERSQSAIYAELSENTLEQIQGDRLGFNVRLTERIAGVLNGYGVHVIQAQLTEFAPCRAIAINGNVAQGNYSLWTGF